MAINNTYVLEVDMKRQMTQRVPKFRKGDSGILIFKLFDDGMEYDISSVTKAELYHKTSKGNIIESKCDFIQYEGKRAIRYVYEAVAMVETGINETLLVVYEGDKTVSIQPFPVVIYDDFKGGAGSFVELIQELQNKINGLVMDLTQTIKLAEKGKPNGVATLDSSGKIPFAQLPSQIDAYIDHIKHTVWKNQVHGLRLNDDGILQYKTGNGSWQNVGFAEDALGSGGAGTQLLDVEITKNNGVVTLTYKGLPTVQLQKIAKGDFEKSYFLTSGSTFTGTSFTVTELGLHTLYYKDSNGNDYIRLFNIEASHLPTPTISVSVNNGDATVNISASTSIKKWAKGSQTIAYFQSQGTVFTGNTFKVDSVGIYTVYYKTTAGVEYVYEFNVTTNQLPSLTISHIISSGEVTMSTPTTPSITVSKWSLGIKAISYFQSNGTTFTGNKFNINITGDYTVYYKFSNGQEIIYTFTATLMEIMSELPIRVYSEETIDASNIKIKSMRIAVLNSRNVTKVTYSGHTAGNTNAVSYGDGNYRVFLDGGAIDVTKSSGNMTINFYNSSDIKVHTAIYKCTSQYNYMVVDNAYVILVRVKSGTSTFTVPSTIEGLPVLDIGSIFYYYDATENIPSITKLIIPSTVISGGRVDSNYMSGSYTKKEVEIHNGNYDTFKVAFSFNNSSIIYAPLNSPIYDKLLADRRDVRPLNV